MTRSIPEDLEGLGEYLAQCVAHIERGVRYRNTDLTNHPIELGEPFSLGESTLAGSLKDFLQLEHHTARSEALTHLAQPIRQRVQSGQAIPLFVTAVELQGDGTLYAEGRLLYDRLFPEDHERIANARQKKATEGSTGGSWMIANETHPMWSPLRAPRRRILSVDQVSPSRPSKLMKSRITRSNSRCSTGSWAVRNLHGTTIRGPSGATKLVIMR
jgi:hypothetical protein